eukprot:CAMPEP_0204589676 /NCGR_PEP_ID=MMETSP0661-20131031/49340_1 /ASSEMBLY_ACC=CAM_ASM_000606 /TAXON_ID=109239 /ORGANISM="Alexandrium margalefi, Strain AMGDE01CS-322" /LENGTH=50 /DNA_ID=CAMNT_0051599613 /DNA_START=8 /DNA_END=160 /DNA_ORIENTATION=+
MSTYNNIIDLGELPGTMHPCILVRFYPQRHCAVKAAICQQFQLYGMQAPK